MAELEKDFAIKLAVAVLDDPNRDPDSDLSVLARQLLRTRERLDAVERTPAELEPLSRRERFDLLSVLTAAALAGFPESDYVPPEKRCEEAVTMAERTLEALERRR